MSILNWNIPKKARPTKEHQERHSSDCGVPGTYVPNMSDEDKKAWKAKKIGGKRPRVDIRKTTKGPSLSDGKPTYAQMIIVVTRDKVQFSTNAKAVFDGKELLRALSEAWGALDGTL
jgi:hypothetical protein